MNEPFVPIDDELLYNAPDGYLLVPYDPDHRCYHRLQERASTTPERCRQFPDWLERVSPTRSLPKERP